jgi:hypothetical protein
VASRERIRRKDEYSKSRGILALNATGWESGGAENMLAALGYRLVEMGREIELSEFGGISYHAARGVNR